MDSIGRADCLLTISNICLTPRQQFLFNLNKGQARTRYIDSITLRQPYGQIRTVCEDAVRAHVDESADFVLIVHREHMDVQTLSVQFIDERGMGGGGRYPDSGCIAGKLPDGRRRKIRIPFERIKLDERNIRPQFMEPDETSFAEGLKDDFRESFRIGPGGIITDDSE